ncbi:MAG: glycosyltransferase [Ferruginibacter sp.]|nr:glycosyltransferase [Ferruginibacter sp.]
MNDTIKPSLLILYDYFYPGYKAGGPVQSLGNLIISLQNDFRIYVVTGSFDLNEEQPLENIIADQWSAVQLPGTGGSIMVWYAGKGLPFKSCFINILKEIDPSVVYLNGIFSYRFVMLPLLSIRNRAIVICPRGMLQAGALAGKSFKKELYLRTLKISGLLKNVTWHATNNEEADDIRRQFGNESKITVAGNFPKKPLRKITYPPKKIGELRLVYLSLISSKKNLLQTIEVLGKLQGIVSLDIYGPVKDKNYWQKCLQAIRTGRATIRYKGDVRPARVQEIFEQYDASVFFTKGENFGHALYESLSSARPVITSFFTPWNNLQQKKAGFNIDISDEEKILSTIDKIVDMNAELFKKYCDGAYTIAKEYYAGLSPEVYKQMFTTIH